MNEEDVKKLLTELAKIKVSDEEAKWILNRYLSIIEQLNKLKLPNTEIEQFFIYSYIRGRKDE